MTTDEIHDMIQKTQAGDTDRILDVLLELNQHIATIEHGIETLTEGQDTSEQ